MTRNNVSAQSSSVSATTLTQTTSSQTFTYQDDLYGTSLLTLSQGETLIDGSYHLGLGVAPAASGAGAKSGGWLTTINLSQPSIVNIRFDYTILLSGNTEAGEYTRLYYRDLATGNPIMGAELQGVAGDTANHTQSNTINYSVSLNSGSYQFDFGAYNIAGGSGEYGEAWFSNILISASSSADTISPSAPTGLTVN